MRISIFRMLSIGVLVFGLAGAAAAQGRGNGNGNNGNGNNGNGNGNQPASVPEIDAASAVQAIALLSGGLLVVRGRRRSTSK
jgi:hypothetical protein